MLSDHDLRALIRDAVVRHLDRQRQDGMASGATDAAGPRRLHPSHDRLPLARGADGDGACLIEPAAGCTHCGYCQSYGH